LHPPMGGDLKCFCRRSRGRRRGREKGKPIDAVEKKRGWDPSAPAQSEGKQKNKKKNRKVAKEDAG